MGLFKDNIEAMAAYVPGAQPENMAGVVKLNQNENPYPPSPNAAEALRAFDAASLRMYPDPTAREFRRVAGEVLGVDPACICVGDGSDDLIIMLARAAAGPGRAIAYPAPTFPYYFAQAQVEAAEVIAVDANDDFSLPIDRLAETDAALTFVAAPNSPTGATATTDQLDRLAGKLSGILVIDEAYVDFADGNALKLPASRDNVIVLRTLSKGYSLAGLRLGFAVAPKAIMTGIMKTKAIYNVGPIPAAVGAAAMADQAYHDRCVAKILAERTRLVAELSRRGFEVFPSQGNFLMVSVPGSDGRAVSERLKARGVLVRYFNSPRLRDKLRISVGNEDENTALLAALDADNPETAP